jgi:subtilisin family serine protease
MISLPGGRMPGPTNMRVVPLVAVLYLVVLTAGAAAGTVPGEVVVGFRGHAAPPRARLATAARLERRIGGRVQVLHARHGRVRATIRALRRLRDVRFAEPNYRYHTASVTPNDTLYNLQWAPASIDAPRAWDYTTGAGSVLLAVVDTGVDINHPDLADNVWTNPGETPGDAVDNDNDGYADDVHGYDFVGGDASPEDPAPPPNDRGHGSHVAGIAAAVGNNGRGIAGVTWDASIMALRACDEAGVCTTANQAAAINLAAAKGARIVNLSIEGSPASAALADAVRNAPNVLFVTSAGNSAANVDSAPNTSYPCAIDAPNLICVAATDANDQLASFSNFGPATVDLGAPGGVDANSQSILAPIPGGNTYIRRAGTSMAAPQVSGAAALLWSYAPSASVATVRDALLDSADPVAALAGKVATGGRLNVFRALAALDTTPPDTTFDSVPTSPTRATSVSFAFRTGELNSSFECRLDAGAFEACTSPRTLTGLADGTHQVFVRAVDPHPNVDPSPATATFVVDTTGPHPRFSSAPPAATANPAAHFAFTFDEPAADPECSLDGAAFAACPSSFDAATADGNHALLIRAADLLGNVATTTYGWQLDRTAPVVLPLTLPNVLVGERSISIGLQASELVAFRCSLDGAAATDCVSPVTFTGLGNGVHHVTITAVDAAGNASLPVSASFTVDAPAAVVSRTPVSTRSLAAPVARLARRLIAHPERRVAISYRARSGGTLAVSVMAGADRIARAQGRIRAAQPLTLEFRLTRTARAAIRTGKLRRARVDATFTPTGAGIPVSASARLSF